VYVDSDPYDPDFDVLDFGAAAFRGQCVTAKAPPCDSSSVKYCMSDQNDIGKHVLSAFSHLRPALSAHMRRHQPSLQPVVDLLDAGAEILSVEYAQLRMPSPAQVLPPEPTDPDVFSVVRGAPVVDRPNQTHGGFYVWSPIHKQWLLQNNKQARVGTLTYTFGITGPEPRIMTMSSAFKELVLVFRDADGSPVANTKFPEQDMDGEDRDFANVITSLFKERSESNKEYGLPVRESPPSARSTQASSTWSAPPSAPPSEPPSAPPSEPPSEPPDMAEEHDGDKDFEFDHAACVIYRTTKNGKEKILDAVILERETIKTNSLKAHWNLLMRKRFNAEGPDVMLEPGQCEYPPDAATVSAWVAIPCDFKDCGALCNLFACTGLDIKHSGSGGVGLFRKIIHSIANSNVNPIPAFGYAAEINNVIMYANCAMRRTGGKWEPVSHLELQRRLLRTSFEAEDCMPALDIESMPRPLIVPEDLSDKVANMFFSSLVPHCFYHNWVPALVGIVHIAVVGKLYRKMTATDGNMAGMLLLHGPPDGGKTGTFRFAEYLHGHRMTISSDATKAGSDVRRGQLGGLAALCWDDFTGDMWTTIMDKMARSNAGGQDAVKMNNMKTYNKANFTSLAVSVHAAPARKSTCLSTACAPA
jgi:hypothetical protein